MIALRLIFVPSNRCPLVAASVRRSTGYEIQSDMAGGINATIVIEHNLFLWELRIHIAP